MSGAKRSADPSSVFKTQRYGRILYTVYSQSIVPTFWNFHKKDVKMFQRLFQNFTPRVYPQNFDRCVNSVRGLYLKNMFDDASIILASKLLCLTLLRCIQSTVLLKVKLFHWKMFSGVLTEVKKLVIKVRQIFQLRTNCTVILYSLYSITMDN